MNAFPFHGTSFKSYMSEQEGPNRDPAGNIISVVAVLAASSSSLLALARDPTSRALLSKHASTLIRLSRDIEAAGFAAGHFASANEPPPLPSIAPSAPPPLDPLSPVSLQASTATPVSPLVKDLSIEHLGGPVSATHQHRELLERSASAAVTAECGLDVVGDSGFIESRRCSHISVSSSDRVRATDLLVASTTGRDRPFPPPVRIVPSPTPAAAVEMGNGVTAVDRKRRWTHDPLDKGNANGNLLVPPPPPPNPAHRKKKPATRNQSYELPPVGCSPHVLSVLHAQAPVLFFDPTRIAKLPFFAKAQPPISSHAIQWKLQEDIAEGFLKLPVVFRVDFGADMPRALADALLQAMQLCGINPTAIARQAASQRPDSLLDRLDVAEIAGLLGREVLKGTLACALPAALWQSLCADRSRLQQPDQVVGSWKRQECSCLARGIQLVGMRAADILACHGPAGTLCRSLARFSVADVETRLRRTVLAPSFALPRVPDVSWVAPTTAAAAAARIESVAHPPPPPQPVEAAKSTTTMTEAVSTSSNHVVQLPRQKKWTDNELASLAIATSFCGSDAAAIHAKHGAQGSVSRTLARFTPGDIAVKLSDRQPDRPPLPKAFPAPVAATAATARMFSVPDNPSWNNRSYAASPVYSSSPTPAAAEPWPRPYPPPQQ
ncbi:hypothetical protein BC828DRAFT_387982 [Blastocladiella britannica]|nr:hypothetical protein BC828DRAFT_387982 [Blastocladiella britannica]